ncbi:MAG: NYN domain-containing protein [Candidatus Sungbacteria bacterium]|nr:NYN domain-containing protein [Candidatus Sungbacteria bacterium]
MDVQNMYHSAKNLYNARVNFKEVVKTAVAGRELVRAVAYVIRTESGDEKPFLEALTKIGIETKLKDLQIFPGGMKKADWDVGIAMDAVKLSNRIDALVLMSGDGDFTPLVDYLHEVRGIQVEVVAFGRSSSQKLKEVADDFVDLGLDPKKYLMRIR